MTTSLDPDIQAALSAIADKSFGHIFLVACGGSLSIMHPGKYFLDRHAEQLRSDVYNGDEFVHRDPRALGPNALVILCSQTGTTKETVRAAKHARSRGATTIGMTLDPNSPLAQAVDIVVSYEAFYTTGVPIDSARGNYAVLYKLLAGILRDKEGADIVPSLLSSLGNLQPAITKAVAQYEPQFEAFAQQFSTKSAVYTLASGADYGAAYSFAICVLMEMQWINSQAIHANEFFHGPFEVVDKDAAFIVMMGLDETRPLEERARDFLLKHGSAENIFVLDGKALDMTGIDEQFQGYLVPLVFFDTLWKFAYLLAAKREHTMLEARRYMKKISDY